MATHSSQRRIDQALERAATREFRVGVSELAAWAGCSSGHFQRQFRRRFGLSPGQFLRHERIERFADHLRAGLSVTDAALEAGFGSSSRVHQAARDGLGMAPSSVSRGGRGELIHYALADSRLGRVLVAATARGLCAVLMGDSDKTLETDLERRFPAAERRPAGEEFKATLQTVVDLIDGVDDHAAPLALDLRGTVFQRKVWAALQRIPSGRTLTYGELARQLGMNSGARAVAQACGANPAAVIVPCHRIVAADGGLGGYRWGLKRKRALLDRERSKS
jgi:AraC family transcriptional regulator of adaptative response/methylated-DNA-[protein]-cysteine methyltransferase